jgi:ankyrin repeat protein
LQVEYTQREYDEILALLETTKFPQKSAFGGANFECALIRLGYTRYNENVAASVSNASYEHFALFKKLHALVKANVPNAKWSTIQINKNFPAEQIHTHKNKKDLTYITTLGSYTTGGEFQYNDEKYNTRCRLLEFKGSLMHGACPYAGGARYSIVFFSVWEYGCDPLSKGFEHGMKTWRLTNSKSSILNIGGDSGSAAGAIVVAKTLVSEAQEVEDDTKLPAEYRDAVRALVGRGASWDWDALDANIGADKESLLHIAAYQGHACIAKALLATITGDDAETRFCNSKTILEDDASNPLHSACVRSSKDDAELDDQAAIVRLFLARFPGALEQRTEDGATPLHIAAYAPNHRAVEVLLQYGAAASNIAKHGWSIFHWAIDPQLDINEGEEDEEDEETRKLRDRGEVLAVQCLRAIVTHMKKKLQDVPALLNQGDHSAGSVPLIWAAWHGFPKILKRLLDLGAEVDKANEFGNTALHFAAYLASDESPGHVECVKVLLQKKAASIKNGEGDWPVDLVGDDAPRVRGLLPEQHGDKTRRGSSGGESSSSSISGGGGGSSSSSSSSSSRIVSGGGALPGYVARCWTKIGSVANEKEETKKGKAKKGKKKMKAKNATTQKGALCYRRLTSIPTRLKKKPAYGNVGEK